jgi:anti-sigma B factor antagonist
MTQIDIIKLDQERLDFSTIVNLEKEVFKVLKTGARGIIIDFSNVSYLDSRAVGMMVSMKMLCNNKKVALAICNLTPDVRYIFKVTAVDTAIPVFETEKEASEALIEEIDE